MKGQQAGADVKEQESCLSPDLGIAVDVWIVPQRVDDVTWP
jgi:hypothetical protein